LVDDYAHHPTEIQAVYDTLQERYPKMEKTVVFQPHLYSRTKDFFEDFAKVLALFDRIFVLPIYPAREEPIEGVTAEALLDRVEHADKALILKKQISPMMSQLAKGVVALLGAGDIGNVAAELKQISI
jgi:UDP-N-acetylmuramate--alanine ligase